MTRRVRNLQTTGGEVLLAGIEDGLPRTEFAYLREQQVYLPNVNATLAQVRWSAGGSGTGAVNQAEGSIPGFADLIETDAVLMHADRGVIRGLVASGVVASETFAPATQATPVVTNAQDGVPGVGDLTITGTTLFGFVPFLSSVRVGAPASSTGTDANVNVNTAVNRRLVITDENGLTTAIVVTAGAATAKTVIRDDLNTGFALVGMTLIADIDPAAANQLRIRSTTAGAAATFTIASVAGGSILSTPLGFNVAGETNAGALRGDVEASLFSVGTPTSIVVLAANVPVGTVVGDYVQVNANAATGGDSNFFEIV